MSEHIPHINARKQSEGYIITDHFFSEASKRRPFVMKVKIDKLPDVASTIGFELEVVMLNKSDNSYFLISYDEKCFSGIVTLIYIGNATVKNQHLMYTGHCSLDMRNHSEHEAKYGKSLCIKYKGVIIVYLNQELCTHTALHCTVIARDRKRLLLQVSWHSII